MSDTGSDRTEMQIIVLSPSESLWLEIFEGTCIGLKSKQNTNTFMIT